MVVELKKRGQERLQNIRKWCHIFQLTCQVWIYCFLLPLIHPLTPDTASIRPTNILTRTWQGGCQGSRSWKGVVKDLGRVEPRIWQGWCQGPCVLCLPISDTVTVGWHCQHLEKIIIWNKYLIIYTQTLLQGHKNFLLFY